jgi:hypothetical protein
VSEHGTSRCDSAHDSLDEYGTARIVRAGDHAFGEANSPVHIGSAIRLFLAPFPAG